MKKILFIITQSEFGGAQRYVFEIARLLNKKLFECAVAAGQGDGELFRKLENTETRSLYLRQMKRSPWPWQIFLSIGEIIGLLKKEKPDVLFLCSTTAGILGSIAALLYKITYRERVSVLYRIGGWAFRDPRPFWKNRLILLIEKLTAPLKDRIIVNCEIDKELALKYKIAPVEKIVKIHNGIDVNVLSFLSREQARLRLGLPGRPSLIIGTVANFYKTKGLEYLIKAASRSDLRGRSDLLILIIGDGRERPKLEKLIKKYDLENKVILAGRIPNAYKYLKAFDVFVLPSLKEGFPWIILEAMAAETPIVATKVGALPEIIESGKEGFLVEPKKSDALAEKLKWLLENTQEAKVMGIQAKAKLAKKFSLQKMIEETEKLLS